MEIRVAQAQSEMDLGQKERAFWSLKIHFLEGRLGNLHGVWRMEMALFQKSQPSWRASHHTEASDWQHDLHVAFQLLSHDSQSALRSGPFPWILINRQASASIQTALIPGGGRLSTQSQSMASPSAQQNMHPAALPFTPDRGARELLPDTPRIILPVARGSCGFVAFSMETLSCRMANPIADVAHARDSEK